VLSMEAAKCKLCSGTHLKALFMKESYSVVHCADCSLRFLDPVPDGKALSAIYNANYFLGEPTPDAEARVLALKRATAALYLDRLMTYLNNGSQKEKGNNVGRLLEIGCGRGELLLEAQARGFEINGVEF